MKFILIVDMGYLELCLVFVEPALFRFWLLLLLLLFIVVRFFVMVAYIERLVYIQKWDRQYLPD